MKNRRHKTLLGVSLLIGIVAACDDASQDYSQIIKSLADRTHVRQVVDSLPMKKQVVVSTDAIDTSVDRRAILKALVARITAGKKTDRTRVEAWVTYVQNRVAAPRRTPIHSDGQMVHDPLWILTNRIGLCGQVARVVTDGLNTEGYKTRVVQLKAHVAAEVYYGGSWHFFDADILSDGEMVHRADGTIPSALEIHRNPALLKSVTPYKEFGNPKDEKKYRYRYRMTFSRIPYYYVKTATKKQEQNIFYGWNHYKTVRPAEAPVKPNS